MHALKRLYNAARVIRARRSFLTPEVKLGLAVTFGPYAVCVQKVPNGSSIRVGNHVYLDCTLVTFGQGTIAIGDNCWIGGSGSTAIGAVDGVTIGDDVIISNHVHIYDNNNHPTAPDRRRAMTRGDFFGPLWDWTAADSAAVTIENNVWIGEFVFVGKGVTIGEGAIIAAHTVVTRDVPPYTVYAGNPGQVVKSIARG